MNTAFKFSDVLVVEIAVESPGRINWVGLAGEVQVHGFGEFPPGHRLPGPGR